MAENVAQPELTANLPSNPLDSAVEVHKRLGGNPEVRDQVEEMKNKLGHAISLIRGDSTRPLNTSRESNVLGLLTGVNFLAEDPHNMGIVPGDDIVNARDSLRLADFVRSVSRLGTLNPDGSV